MNNISTLFKQYLISFKDNYPEAASTVNDMGFHKKYFMDQITVQHWLSQIYVIDKVLNNVSKNIKILDLGTQFGILPHFLKSIEFTNVDYTNSFKEAGNDLQDLQLCWDKLLDSPPINLHISPQEDFTLPKKYDIILCTYTNMLWRHDKILKISNHSLDHSCYSFLPNGKIDTFFTPYSKLDIQYFFKNLQKYLTISGKAAIGIFPFPYYMPSFEDELDFLNHYEIVTFRSNYENIFHKIYPEAYPKGAYQWKSDNKGIEASKGYHDYVIINNPNNASHQYYIAGNRGLVGSNYSKFKKHDIDGGNTSIVDYTDIDQTRNAISSPTHVIINAATVGGLLEDMEKSFELLIRNLKIQNNLFEVCAEKNIPRVLLQGSTCSYPEFGNQPFTESQLFQGKPYDAYLTTALPKLVGMYQCIAHNKQYDTKWRIAINSNLFGPGDRTGKYAHFVGALMQKILIANRLNQKTIEIWGSGNQSRDFLYIKDAIPAMDLILNNDKYDIVNVARGIEITIKELVETLIKVTSFKGNVYYNTKKPEGIKNRAIDNSRLKTLGWEPKYSLEDALAETYNWYYDNT